MIARKDQLEEQMMLKLANKIFLATSLVIALSAGSANAYYSGYTTSATEIKVQPSNGSRTVEEPGAGRWLVFSHCNAGWCSLSDRNLSSGWIKKNQINRFKRCPSAVCASGR